MSNINNSYFDGYYKDIWRSLIPENLTVKEVDFLRSFFGLQPGSRVLDIMCGYGRHAIALARTGVHVTAIDNLADYTREMETAAKNESLPLQVITGDVLDFEPGKAFDLAICMGNSLNFFDASDTTRLLTNLANQLREGGAVLINSWSITEIVFQNFHDKISSKVGEWLFTAESVLKFHPTRIETRSTIVGPDDRTEIKNGVDYIFSINEMENMIKEAGLSLEGVYSIPGKKHFTAGEPRAYFIARKA